MEMCKKESCINMPALIHQRRIMEGTLIALVSIGIGIAVLFLGKDLRIFAIAAGLLFGIQIASIMNAGLLTGLLLGAVSALIGVILVILGRSVIALVMRLIGAAAGASALSWLLNSMGIHGGLLTGVGVAAAGAIIGYILMARFYDWGLSILVSLIAASLIVSGVNFFIPLGDGVTTAATLALTAAGIILQRRR